MTDDRGEAEWPIKRRRDRIDTASAAEAKRPAEERRTIEDRRVVTRRPGINPVFIALGGLVALLVVILLVVGRGSSTQDKLTTGNTSQRQSAASDPEKLCGSKQVYELIKRELFRQAAQARGSDQSTFDRLSSYAALRVENPVMESTDDGTRRVNCSASLSLDLPPGLTVNGGRSTLTSDADYSVQPAADGSGNALELRNADAIVSALATLSRSAPAATPAAPTVEEQPAAEEPPSPPAVATPPSPTVERPEPSQPSRPANGPAFDCSRATNANERAVCSDPDLSALDRQMSAAYRGALADADPSQRALLVQTGRRFIAYRNRCGSTDCIVEAYHGRLREVRDIMAGRWNP